MLLLDLLLLLAFDLTLLVLLFLNLALLIVLLLVDLLLLLTLDLALLILLLLNLTLLVVLLLPKLLLLTLLHVPGGAAVGRVLPRIITLVGQRLSTDAQTQQTYTRKLPDARFHAFLTRTRVDVIKTA